MITMAHKCPTDWMVSFDGALCLHSVQSFPLLFAIPKIKVLSIFRKFVTDLSKKRSGVVILWYGYVDQLRSAS